MKLFASLVLLAVGAFSAKAAVILNVSASDPAVGQFFTVDVNLTDAFANSPGDLLLGFGFDVTVTPGVATFVGHTPAAPFVAFSSPDTDVAASNSDLGFVFPASFLLTQLTFQKTGAGPAVITLSGNPASSSDQGIIYLFAATEPISATASLAAVPEPATGVMTLFGAALAGALWRVRRRR